MIRFIAALLASLLCLSTGTALGTGQAQDKPQDKQPSTKPTTKPSIPEMLEAVPENVLPKNGKWGLIAAGEANKILEKKWSGKKIVVAWKVTSIKDGNGERYLLGGNPVLEPATFLFRGKKVELLPGKARPTYELSKESGKGLKGVSNGDTVYLELVVGSLTFHGPNPDTKAELAALVFDMNQKEVRLVAAP